MTTTSNFLGRYRLVKVLGQGAMGVVYEAVDTRLNRTVAIKTVLRSHLADETTATEYATRFEREAQAAARLSHPHVVTVFDFGEHEDISYIVMEFVRGRELNQAFESGESFPLHEAVRIMCELLKALDYAHQQGVVHRDVKPANVMLDPAGRVKLTDFGVARVANANQDRTMPGTLVGTPSYMSPEQILGMAVGSRTDIFAAGVILYQFLTGRRPFSGGGPFGVQRKIVQDDPEPPSRVNPAVPPGFDAIVARALAKQPENRYESAGAFAADLERIGATLQREVPLIDLDLADEPPPPAGGTSAAASVTRPLPASPPPQPAPRPRPSSPPPEPEPQDLTLITAVPFGLPPAPPAQDKPFDPDATIITMKPADGAIGLPPAGVPKAPPPAAGAAGGRTQAGPSASMSTTTRAAPAPAPRPPLSPLLEPSSPSSGVSPAAAAQAHATVARSSVAAPRPAAPASMQTRAGNPPAPAPVPAAAQRPAAGQEAPPPKRSSKAALIAGAVVALVALAAWLALARPWSAKSVPAGDVDRVTSSTPVPAPSAAPAAPGGTATDPASVAGATPGAGAAASPAPAAPSPAPEAASQAAAGAAPNPTRRAPAESPAKPVATQRTDPARPAAEPRCSDLLQRMQLGEPLTADQTAYFQSRCTR